MKPIAPLQPQSERTVVKTEVANALVDGANAINAMRGDSDGIKVTHSDSNIVVDLLCPVPSVFAVNRTVTYYKTGGGLLSCPPLTGTPTPETYTSSNTVGADQSWDLYSYFPERLFWDGNCGISPRLPGSVASYPQTRTALNKWGEHPDLTPLTIGPFTKRVIVFAASELYVDDNLYYSISGGSEVRVGTTETAAISNTPLFVLGIGQTARFRVLETGGAYCWAMGHIGVKPVYCCPKAWREQLGI